MSGFIARFRARDHRLVQGRRRRVLRPAALQGPDDPRPLPLDGHEDGFAALRAVVLDDGGRPWEVNWITDRVRVKERVSPVDPAADSYSYRSASVGAIRDALRAGT